MAVNLPVHLERDRLPGALDSSFRCNPVSVQYACTIKYQYCDSYNIYMYSMCTNFPQTSTASRTLPRACFFHHPTPPQPRVLPPDGYTETRGANGPPSSSLPSFVADALDEQGSAFSSLLRADVGRALGVSMEAVAVGGVLPAGETVVNWQGWRQWGQGALNVSLTGVGGGWRGCAYTGLSLRTLAFRPIPVVES